MIRFRWNLFVGSQLGQVITSSNLKIFHFLEREMSMQSNSPTQGANYIKRSYGASAIAPLKDWKCNECDMMSACWVVSWYGVLSECSELVLLNLWKSGVLSEWSELVLLNPWKSILRQGMWTRRWCCNFCKHTFECNINSNVV